MRRLRFAALGFVLVVGGFLVWARLFAGGPVAQIPGGWLRGEPARELPRDWGFANAEKYLLVESDAWTLPYSASVWFLAYEGRLHLLLPSFFGDGLKRRLDDDPSLTVKLGGTLYPQVAVRVDDADALGPLLAPVIRRQFAIEISGAVRPVGKAAELWVYRLDDPPSSVAASPAGVAHAAAAPDAAPDAAPAAAPAPRADERARMVDAIDVHVVRSAGETGVTTLSPRVRQALLDVPRHAFVPAAVAEHAYADTPLPIGRDQTISQPFIVALMTELARVGPGDTVLEVGTGSGYQAAILGRLAKQVYTIEIVRELADVASERLARLGFANVVVRAGDGYAGWPEHAPFAAIVVTAGAETLPPALVEQLAKGGRLVIPLGPDPQAQELVLIEKDADGRASRRTVMSVRFVPLTRELR